MQLALKANPEVAATAIREGIAATGRGLQKLKVRLGQSGRFVNAMLRRNRQTWDPTDVLNGGGPTLVREVTENQTGFARERWNTYRRLAAEFVDRHTRNGVLQRLTAEQLHKFKNDADDIAKPIFRRIAANEKVDVTENATATWHKAMADWAREQLEQTTPPAIDPVTRKLVSLAEANARSSGLIRLKEVLSPEVRKGMSAGAAALARARNPLASTVSGMALGAGSAAAVPGGDNSQQALWGALLGGLAGNPAAMSRIAMLLSNPLLAGALRQAPRGVMMAAH